MRQPTRVVNVRSGERYDVYCGRPGKGLEGPFGNPFVVGGGFSRGEAVKAFAEWFVQALLQDPAYKSRVENILKLPAQFDPIVLACFCAPIPGFLTAKKPHVCHAQVIAEYIDRRIRNE